MEPGERSATDLLVYELSFESIFDGFLNYDGCVTIFGSGRGMMSKKTPLIRDARGNELKLGDTVYLRLQEPLILATITEGPRPMGDGTYELLLTSRGLAQYDPSEPITWIVGQGMAGIFDQPGQIPGFKTEAEARQAARLMFGIEKSDKGYTIM